MRKKGNFILYGIVLAGLATCVGLFMFLSSSFKTETYYVLNQDVPSRTQINPDMLTPIVTSKGTAPKNALNVSDVQDGTVFSQFPLNEGDIISKSSVGGYEDISVGVPDEWVITNFSVNADNAVQGRIRRGTYFDLMVVGPNGAFYPFVNILALDATVSLSGASSADAVETQEAHNGQTSHYTVGMTPSDAAKLQDLVVNAQGEIRLVLSPRQNEYNAPRIEDYAGVFRYGEETKDVDRKPSNQGEGTDYTFSHIERDEFGRPVAVNENCSEGNSKISGKACKNLDKKQVKTKNNKTSTQKEEPKTSSEPEIITGE